MEGFFWVTRPRRLQRYTENTAREMPVRNRSPEKNAESVAEKRVRKWKVSITSSVEAAGKTCDSVPCLARQIKSLRKDCKTGEQAVSAQQWKGLLRRVKALHSEVKEIQGLIEQSQKSGKRVMALLGDAQDAVWKIARSEAQAENLRDILRDRGRPAIGDGIKRDVVQRQEYKCADPYFTCPLEEQKLQQNPLTRSLEYVVDHVIPYATSLDHRIENLQALCHGCHRRKTSKEAPQLVKDAYRRRRQSQ